MLLVFRVVIVGNGKEIIGGNSIREWERGSSLWILRGIVIHRAVGIGRVYLVRKKEIEKGR